MPEWIMMDAWLHRNWEGASREAAQLIELYPTLYDTRCGYLKRLGVLMKLKPVDALRWRPT
jgi:hypothetical protein